MPSFLISPVVRIGLPRLKQVLAGMHSLGVDHICLVAQQTIATPTSAVGPAAESVSVLPWQLVLTYPLDHELVPRHRRATAEDLSHLPTGSVRRASGMLPALHPAFRGDGRHAEPCLRTTDPIVQYLGLRAGEIVRIDRHDGSTYFRTGRTLVYASCRRVVVPASGRHH